MMRFPRKYIPGGDSRAATEVVLIVSRFCALLALSVILSMGILATVGCQKDITDDTKNTDVIQPSKRAQVGPVTLSIGLSRDIALTTERVNIRIELQAPKGVTVHLEDYDQTLRDSDYWFDLRLTHASKKTAVPLDADTLVWSQEYEVEFLLAQEYKLPGAKATFVDVRGKDSATAQADATPKSQTINTDSVLLRVQRPADAVELTEQELHKIETLPPIDLPAKWSRWWLLGPVIAMAALAGIALLLYLGSRIFPPMAKLWLALKRFAHLDDSGEALPMLPAHEWAYAEIDRLLREDLLRKGSVQRFYYGISDIVRGYVERRFDVSAPEMTTEEFLSVTAKDMRFEQDQQASLSGFLSACDTVKYAGQIPHIEQGDEITGAAKQFVDRTKRLDDVDEHELASNSQPVADREIAPQ